MSPEILTGKMGEITVAADLWALGCIIFQMLVGRPPFRGESEYLTFQKVVNKDFGEIPDLADDANTLIDGLLKINPSERLGACDGGYSMLKKHAFFKDISWETLWIEPPPLNPIQPNPKKFTERNVGDLTAALDDMIEKSKQMTVHSRSSDLKGRQKWQQFCDLEESILRYGMVKKHRGLMPKKRELILTNRPRLLYIDPISMLLKGEISFSDGLDVVVKDEFFTVSVPGRDYKIEDIGKDAPGWAAAILNAKTVSSNEEKC